MPRIFNTALIGTALIGSLMIIPRTSLAQDHKADQAAAVRYHDKVHNDDHEWNDHENQAYRMWVKDTHRKDIEFSKLKDRDRQNYWNWRHDHRD